MENSNLGKRAQGVLRGDDGLNNAMPSGEAVAARRYPDLPDEGERDLLAAPCRWCGYNGPDYWQPGTHPESCPWHRVGGRVARRDLLGVVAVPEKWNKTGRAELEKKEEEIARLRQQVEDLSAAERWIKSLKRQNKRLSVIDQLASGNLVPMQAGDGGWILLTRAHAAEIGDDLKRIESETVARTERMRDAARAGRPLEAHTIVFGRGEVMVHTAYTHDLNRVTVHLLSGKHGHQVGEWHTAPKDGEEIANIMESGYTLEFANEQGLQVLGDGLEVARAALRAIDADPSNQEGILDAMRAKSRELGDPHLNGDAPAQELQRLATRDEFEDAVAQGLRENLRFGEDWYLYNVVNFGAKDFPDWTGTLEISLASGEKVTVEIGVDWSDDGVGTVGILTSDNHYTSLEDVYAALFWQQLEYADEEGAA